MKNRSLLILFIVSSLLVIAGAYLKILHYQYADAVLGGAMLFQLAVIVFFLVKAFRTPRDAFWDN